MAAASTASAQCISSNDTSASPRRASLNSGLNGLFRRWLNTPIVLGNGQSERDLLVHKMSQWLIQHDRQYYDSHVVADINDAIAEILDIITNLVGMLKSSSQMLAIIMLYADKFVKRSGIKHNQLFNLLLTSTVVTVKFWNEAVVVSNKNIAQVFEFSLDDVNLMERRFLAGVDYGLVLSEDDVRTFLFSLLNEHQLATASPATVNSQGAFIHHTLQRSSSCGREKSISSSCPMIVDALYTNSTPISIAAAQ